MTLSYVICDTDGCLVPEDKSKPPLETDISPYRSNLETIGKLLLDHNLISSMCTVRSLAAGLPVREFAGINGYCGFEGGNLIYTPEGEAYVLAKQLWKDGEKRVSAVQRFAEDLYKRREEICQRAYVPPEDVRPLTDRKIVLTWEWTRRDQKITDAIWSIIDQYYLPDDVSEMIGRHELILSFSDIAFDLSCVTKVDAVKHMLGLTRIPKNRTLGIGDRKHSDGPFMELTRYVACPNNADKKLQEYVRRRDGYVSPYENGGGVLDILKYAVTHWI